MREWDGCGKLGGGGNAPLRRKCRSWVSGCAGLIYAGLLALSGLFVLPGMGGALHASDIERKTPAEGQADKDATVEVEVNTDVEIEPTEHEDIFKPDRPKNVWHALEWALTWLARTQEEDGRWDSVKHGGEGGDITITALAIMAYTGAGNSSRDGRYRRNVRAAQEYLLSKRDEVTGRIGEYGMESAITLMAMAEAYAMNNDRKLLPVVEAQLADVLRHQATNGGWGSVADTDPEAAKVDPYITGWMLMGVKAAVVAGVDEKSDHEVFGRVEAYFRSLTRTHEDGTVTSGLPGEADSPGITAISLACLQFSSSDREDPLVKGQAEFFLRNPQFMVSDTYTGKEPYPEWFFLSCGMVQIGGRSVYLKTFHPKKNEQMLKLLEVDDKAGFWPTRLPWREDMGEFARLTGRVGVTALGCMIVEAIPCRCYVGDFHKQANPTE